MCLLIGEAVRNESVTSVDRLLFHERCGLHAAVINSQCTAHRPQSAAVYIFTLVDVVVNRRLISVLYIV